MCKKKTQISMIFFIKKTAQQAPLEANKAGWT
jgi:hypothetical protein